MTLEAIEHSSRPIAITHANPAIWHPALRNKSDDQLRTLGDSGRFLGLPAYPHHLKGISDCTLQEWCDIAALAVDLVGPATVGVDTDLCQDQRDRIVE